jgi:hypothetical protein
LHWLIHEGHVIEFANGVLETAKKPLPKPPRPEKTAARAAAAATPLVEPSETVAPAAVEPVEVTSTEPVSVPSPEPVAEAGAVAPPESAPDQSLA